MLKACVTKYVVIILKIGKKYQGGKEISIFEGPINVVVKNPVISSSHLILLVFYSE